jgi:hypothetical protein
LGLPEQVALLAAKIPGLKIVMGHMGTAAHALRAIDLASRCENLYLETSLQQSPFRLSLAVREVEETRVLFGSAMPYSHQGFFAPGPWDYEAARHSPFTAVWECSLRAKPKSAGSLLRSSLFTWAAFWLRVAGWRRVRRGGGCGCHPGLIVLGRFWSWS